ncbi:MAG: site-2 protease family protein, partial [Bradymonadaceae bacterium]
YAKGTRTGAVGGGQTSRVDSSWIGSEKGGDEILALEGRKYGNWRLLNKQIKSAIYKEILKQREQGKDEIDVQKSFELTYERGDEVHTTTITPEVINYTGERDQPGYRIYLMPDDVSVPLGERISWGFTSSLEQTWQFTEMTAMAFVRLAQGRISSKTLGGPIMIGNLAAEAGRAGLAYFLKMMALISINLGLINLLPIPVLDGGHLMFYAIEAVRRKPLSYRTRQIATYIGFAIVVFLMLLAFKNDIEANWGHFVEWLNSW